MSDIPDIVTIGQSDVIHHEGYDSTIVSPFVPAIRVASGPRSVFISGVTGAPVYHDHPHKPEVFDAIPVDGASQARIAFEHLDQALRAAGAERRDVVNLIRFFTDVAEDQDEVNRIQAEWFGGHVSTSTTVEVSRLATDPRLRLEIHVVAAAPPA
ncbi:RidA family protein [Streptosporangium canum]|uniref:RidA family protein n=1 Tax=Streptosporangium canum TaxID=324952 RepID=UPI0037A0BBA6